MLPARLARIAVVAALTILVGFAEDGPDARACGAADNGSFGSAAEERAKNSATGAADESALTRANAALMVVASFTVIAPVIFAIAVTLIVAVVISVATALIGSLVEPLVRSSVVSVLLVVPVLLVSVLRSYLFCPEAGIAVAAISGTHRTAAMIPRIVHSLSRTILLFILCALALRWMLRSRNQ